MKKLFVFLFVLALAEPASADTIQSSMRRLVAAGQSVTCTFDKTDPPAQKGTIYVAAERMRADMQVADPDGSGEMLPMHMLRDADWMYLWGGMLGDTQGMKMKAAEGASQGPGRGGPDMDEELAMECHAWTADERKFTLPEGVQFNELGMGFAGAGPGAGVDMQAMRCMACDQAPPEEQAQCRQLMGCS